MAVQKTYLQDFTNPAVQQEITLDEQTTAKRILESAHYDSNTFALEYSLPDGATQRFGLDEPVYPAIQRGASLKVVPESMGVAK